MVIQVPDFFRAPVFVAPGEVCKTDSASSMPRHDLKKAAAVLELAAFPSVIALLKLIRFLN